MERLISLAVGTGALLMAMVYISWPEGDRVADGFESASPPSLYFPAEGAEPMPGPLADGVALELVFEVGTLDEPEAEVFGTIQDLAVSSDSLVAVADRFGCAIRVFRFPSGEHVSDLGGCGDGPGEFRQLFSIAFKADTLLAFDLLRARIFRIDPRTGEQLSSDLSPFPWTEAPAMFLHPSDDAVLYAPFWSRASSSQNLLVVHADDGSTYAGLTDAEISLTNRDLSLSRWTEACRFQDGGRSVAANPWAPQVVVVDRQLRPYFNHVDDTPWVGPREEGGPGRWMPGFAAPRAACGDSIALVRYRADEREGRLGRGLLLVISSSGELLQREVVADTTWPHPTAMAPVAGLGDVIFFFQNTTGPYPSVRGYRVLRAPGDR
jgi:hypothetical protein